MTSWSAYDNTERPHSSLGYLYPVDYYRGDPPDNIGGAKRREKLAEAFTQWEAYWRIVSGVRGQDDPSHNWRAVLSHFDASNTQPVTLSPRRLT